LKANHNIAAILPLDNLLFIRSKIQFFESKSQHGICHAVAIPGCLSDQRYNFLKANHNYPDQSGRAHLVVYQIKDTIF